jgi:glucose-6-phosphate-specific signal transduction histidine kinase
LVDTAEAFDFVVAIVFLHTTAKCMLWKVKHYLSEDELTYMHDLPQKYRNNPEF